MARAARPSQRASLQAQVAGHRGAAASRRWGSGGALPQTPGQKYRLIYLSVGALAAIKVGADVNLLDIRAQTAGPNGLRPLNYAAYRNDTEMIKVLLRAGAMINGQNLSGFTPLHH